MKIDNYQALIGPRIAHHRGLLGLTQRELAEKAGVSKVYITSIEGGKQIPSFKSTVKIANALGVDWKQLTISPVLKKIESLEIEKEDKELLLSLLDNLGKLV